MVAAEFPEVDLIASPTNLGFSAATNLGARRSDSPFLLALNPDTAVTAGALDTVLATMEAHPEVGHRRTPPAAPGRLARSRVEALLPDTAERARATSSASAAGPERAEGSPTTARRRSSPARSTRSTAPSC